MSLSILKSLLASLIAGALLWTGLLAAVCVYLQPTTERPSTASLLSGSSESIALDSTGQASRVLREGPLEAAELPLLHLRISGHENRGVKLALRWQTHLGDRHSPVPIEFVDDHVWFFLVSQGHWRGEVSGLELLVTGPPGTVLKLEGANLKPLSPGNALRSLHWHWTRTPTWSLQSVNVYRAGWPEQSLIQPAPAVFLWLLLSVLAYTALRLVTRRGAILPVIGGLFLTCWIALDLLWLHRLAHQHMQSRDMLAGKTDAEKRRGGPDGGLIELAEKVRAAIPSEDTARVFVASGNDYVGMRSAYYLMPLNTYWRRGDELPEPQFMRSGDFVLLLPPAGTVIDVARRSLRLPDGFFLPVQPVTGNPLGTLFRVL